MPQISKNQDKINELFACLDDLEKAGLTLRNALLARRSEAIWSTLELQERALLRFDKLRRELGLKEGRRIEENIFPPERRETFLENLARTRILQRLNQSLTRVFLELIEKTLRSINAHSGQQPLTYSANGFFGRATGPLFVHQKG